MKLIPIVFLLLSFSYSSSQTVLKKSNEAGRLPWVLGNLPSNADFYNYKVVQGQGSDLILARNNTVQNLAFELGTERGVNISSETISSIQEKVEQLRTTSSSNFSEKITIKQAGFDMTFSKIDEYYEIISENGVQRYNVWHIYAIGNNISKIPKLRFTSKYKMSDAGFRSAIIPGWGQFFKKRKTKGYIFAIAAAASVGGFVYTNNEYNYNINRISETSSLSLKKEFSSRADNFKSYKNLALGAMATTWIWSIVDAISTDGEPKYANAPKLKFNIINPSKQEGLAFLIKYDF